MEKLESGSFISVVLIYQMELEWEEVEAND